MSSVTTTSVSQSMTLEPGTQTDYEAHRLPMLPLAQLAADHLGGVRPALVVGFPVGFVSAAESKALMETVSEVPWIVIQGRKGGSTLVVAAIHALLGLAEAEQRQ